MYRIISLHPNPITFIVYFSELLGEPIPIIVHNEMQTFGSITDGGIRACFKLTLYHLVDTSKLGL